jgi:hypothetical protein
MDLRLLAVIASRLLTLIAPCTSNHGISTSRLFRHTNEVRRTGSPNASIASLVYLDGIPVSLVAKRRGVHRSAIYQHLWRVRDALVFGIVGTLSSIKPVLRDFQFQVSASATSGHGFGLAGAM